MFRKRANYPGQFRIFSPIQEMMGEGAFSLVTGVEERSADETKGCPIIRKNQDQERVVKCIRATEKNFWDSDEVLENALDEYNHNKKAKHLRVKELVEDSGKYYIVMAKAPGVTLKKIIEDIRENKLKLSSQEYFRLCIAIAIAIQKQVHDEGLIHRDIKPDNIMVDMSNPSYPLVTIIDYGLSKNIDESDIGERNGSPMYIAPEVVKELGSTEKSDVFSLGITLAHLIGFKTAKAFPLAVFLEYFMFPGTINISILPTLPRIEMQNLIKGMCDHNESSRFSLKKVISELHTIRLTQKTNGLSAKDKKDIEEGCQAALHMSEELEQAKSLTQIKQLIQNALFDDSNPVAIDEFLKTLNMRALARCRTKAEILERIDAIAKAYQEKCEALGKHSVHLADFKVRYGNSPLFKKEQLGAAIDQYQHILTRKIEKHAAGRFNTLDEFEQATVSMSRAINHLPTIFEMMIEKRCHRVFNRTFSWQSRDNLVQALIKLQTENKHADREMRILIDSIKQGISNYLNNNGSRLNLFFGFRAGSSKRLQDMNDLLAIINDEGVSSVADMKQRVSARLEAIDLGHFECSELKNEVEQSLKIDLRP